MRAFLPDETRITAVSLRTGDLERALGFYVGQLGFQVVERRQREAKLGTTETGPALIVLNETPGASPRPDRATGLFHLAIRYPTRQDLADAVAKLLILHNYPIEGASDHLVSEAIYLSDPEGNGIELYADRPRSEWVWRDGQIVMATEPLNLQNLLGGKGRSLAPHIAPQADLGHIHLNVADLAAADRFYHEFLGLAVTTRSYPGALFFSAGGYHHHLAANTWAGDRPPPSNTAGLISYRLTVPEAEILYCLRHRAPLAGYEARTEAGEDGSELLQIRDPNGTWLEVHSERVQSLAFSNHQPKSQLEHENKHQNQSSPILNRE